MSTLACPQFHRCSAPLCPLDESSLRAAVWFPTEEICSHIHEPWIRRQLKLRRKADEETIFTYKMLLHDCRIRKGVQGLDPELVTPGQVEKWKRNHPEITAAFRAKSKAQMLWNVTSGRVGAPFRSVQSAIKSDLTSEVVNESGRPPEDARKPINGIDSLCLQNGDTQ
jgi:hypothetical protein